MAGVSLLFSSMGKEYAGKPVPLGVQCHLKVWVWDKDAAVSAWSAAARWTMGLLTPEAWSARWIGAVATAGQTSSVIQLREEFALERGVKRAVVSVCSLDFYELRLNGQKVGERALDPSWTNYRKTCLYSAYDVTAQLAAEALRDTNNHITEIAFSSGFNDSNYFSRQFHTFFGMSPRKYRRQSMRKV
jgi:hypothetical protein